MWSTCLRHGQDTSKAYMEYHNQVAGIMYLNLCAEYGWEVSPSKWEIYLSVVEIDMGMILQNFQIHKKKLTHWTSWW